MYEAFHEADCSLSWDDLPDNRRWFWRRAAMDGLIEIAAIADELEAEGREAEQEAQAVTLVRRVGASTSRTIRIDKRAG